MKLHLKLPRLKMRRRKKVRATAVRRPMRATAADYEGLAEPNMKLSRALLIVLILHVVAVSGIIAFNAIKTRQGPTLAPEPAKAAQVSTSGSTSKTEAARPAAAPVEIKRAHAVTRPADDSHKTYVVMKGDNPVTIAKKFKVPYDELIGLNHIDDPRKLQIGQKLLIPNKTTKERKSSD